MSVAYTQKLRKIYIYITQSYKQSYIGRDRETGRDIKKKRMTMIRQMEKCLIS